jgi:CRP-like cAMP-binding protein/uncharacterized protein YhbP (UPF0306 family)
MNQTPLDLPAHVLDYLNAQTTLTLATASPSGIPHASTFLYVNEGPVLFFWTKPDTTTAHQVEQNPMVSFAIDEYTEDLRQTKGVQGSGECDVLLRGEEIARVAHLFGQKFPALSPGVTLSIAFFRISPTQLEFIDNTAAEEEERTPRENTFGAEFHRERAFSVFTHLPEQQFQSVAATLQTVRAQAGDVIVRQGGPADKFFIVADGEVEVVRERDGQPEVLDTLQRGQFFGEPTIIRDAPRRATMRATQATTLLAMDRATFRDVIAQALGTTSRFDEVIRSRLDTMTGQR